MRGVFDYGIAPAFIAIAFIAGCLVQDHYREKEIAALRRAADLTGAEQSKFWRDEALNAYQSVLTNTR